MNFQCERLVELRTKKNISRAEAARRLNMSAMGYGRYEKGEREPSFQTVTCIAEVFGTSTNYLLGLSEDPSPVSYTVSLKDDPELFAIIDTYKKNANAAKRLAAYVKKLQ